MRTRGIRLAFLTLAAGVLAVSSQAAGLESLRVLCVYSNCFDYVFASEAGVSGNRPLLAFNHLGGRTYFAKVGDAFAGYKVKHYEPRTERVFNESLNAFQNRKSGTAVLEDDNGKKISLDLGKPMARPGLLALLVDQETGSAGYVRSGDLLDWGPVEARVTKIAPGVVTVTAEDAEHTLGKLAKDEYERLVAKWKQQRETESKEKPSLSASESEPVRSQHMDAANLVAAPPSRLVRLTFNPLRIVSVSPARRTLFYSVGFARGADGRTGVQVNPIEMSVPMPQFHTVEYRGTVSVYAR
jgi:hypothetical protein